MEPEWDDYRLKNIIRMQSMVVGYDSEAALDELSKYSFASSDFDQVTVAVRRTAERVGQIPEDVDKQVKNIANKLNIKREKFQSHKLETQSYFMNILFALGLDKTHGVCLDLKPELPLILIYIDK